MRLYQQQDGKCYWCGGEMSLESAAVPRPDYASFEHLSRRADGGKSDFQNVVLAHVTCNQKRDGQKIAALAL